MTITYGLVPAGFSPPLPTPLEQLPVYIKTGQDLPGYLNGLDITGYRPGLFGEKEGDYAPRVWQAIREDLARLTYDGSSPPHPDERDSVLSCHYYEGNTGFHWNDQGQMVENPPDVATFLFWFRQRPNWAEPKPLRATALKHPLLKVGAPRTECPIARADVDPLWEDKLAYLLPPDNKTEPEPHHAPEKKPKLTRQQAQARFVKACSRDYRKIQCLCAYEVLAEFNEHLFAMQAGFGVAPEDFAPEYDREDPVFYVKESPIAIRLFACGMVY